MSAAALVLAVSTQMPAASMSHEEAIADWAELDPGAADDVELAEPLESLPDATPAPTARRPGLPDDDATLAALIGRVVDRDQKALAQLYDTTSARVYGLVLRFTQRAALAEEVVEDTFWQIWRQAPRFDAGRGRPITWILAMARSRAIDALRRDERFRHEELPEEGGPAGEGAAPPPQDLIDAARGSEALHAALRELDAKARQLVSLAFFRGLTHEEIARQEGLPLGTVKSLIRRALLQLRRALSSSPVTGASAEVTR